MPVEDQASIGAWNRATFPGGDDMGSQHVRRLLMEVAELGAAVGMNRALMVLTVREAWTDAGRKKGIEYADAAEDLSDPEKVNGEMADVAILLDVLADRRGVDLRAEVDKKMAINRARKWRINRDGTGQHIEE